MGLEEYEFLLAGLMFAEQSDDFRTFCVLWGCHLVGLQTFTFFALDR